MSTTTARAADRAIYVSGEFRVPRSGESMTSYEKATGETLGSVGRAGPEDVADAVAAARAAQPSWSALPPVARSEAMSRVADEVQARSEEITTLIARETGGIRFKAELEVRLALAHLRNAAALAVRPMGHMASSVMPGRNNHVRRVPVGTVGIITPWNLPFALTFSPLAPCLALGNTAVLKPAPHTPISGGMLIAELLDQAGVPDGVFNVVPGGDDAGIALVENDGLDMIRFTGSTAVGRSIARSAGERLKPVSLEMGGNAAFVVLDDADPDVASMVGAWSSFHFQGQTCITAGRHIVMRGVADAYVAALAARASKLVLGNPVSPDVDMGPMIDERQLAHAHDLVERSVAQGATVVEGGTFDGLFYRPTVLTDVTPDMPVFREEIFGPIAPVTVVDSEEEALQLANDTGYGLSNAVFGGDTWRAQQFAERLQSGMVHVNDATCISEATIPFGGWGDSSLGAPTGADANLEQFTKHQWISVQATPTQYRY